MKKKQNPRPIHEIMAEAKEMAAMSCKPQGRKLPQNHIIDETKSVIWNRKQVAAHNETYLNAVKDLNRKKNEWRDKLVAEIAEYISAQTDGKVTPAGAKLIWGYAYSESHSYGIESVFNTMNELVELFNSALNAKEGG